MQNNTAVRTTSVYSLRVALTPHENPQAFLTDLFAEVEAAGAVVTDTHHATAAGTPYASVSYRIPSSDDDALALARRLLDATTREPREAYLHTGLGVHRRIISEFPPVAPAVEPITARPATAAEAGRTALLDLADEATNAAATAAVLSGSAAWHFDPQISSVVGLISAATERALVVVYRDASGVAYDHEVSDDLIAAEDDPSVAESV